MDLTDKYLKKFKAEHKEPRGCTSERFAFRIYSDLLGAFLWVTLDDCDVEVLKGQSMSEPIYTHREMQELRKMPKKALKVIHEAKEVFPSASVEEVATRSESQKGG